MKKITLVFLLVGMTGWTQIKGNGNLITKEISMDELTSLEMNLYAKVVIDGSVKQPTLSITTDSNIINLVNTDVIDGHLNLVQNEWIKPSDDIQITIGAASLRQIQVGVHETVLVKNMEGDYLSLIASIGKIKASGKISKATIDVENGTVDASALIVNQLFVNIKGRGRASVNAIDYLETQLSDNARFKMVNTPKVIRGDSQKPSLSSEKNKALNGRYIKFKIKNNSWNRNHFVVVGEKPAGGTFSYGFAMMPGSSRDERWTIGTKVYDLNRLGDRKLIYTVTDDDEGNTVKLFQ